MSESLSDELDRQFKEWRLKLSRLKEEIDLKIYLDSIHKPAPISPYFNLTPPTE